MFAFLLGFCALLLLILWLLQTVFLTDMYKFIRKTEIKKAIALVEKNIDSPDLQAILRKLETEKEILVMPTNDFVPPQRPGEERYAPTSPRPRYEAIEQKKEFVLQGEKTISLTFYAIITPVEATVSTLKTQMYIIAAATLLLAVAFAFFISKRLSRPIEQINESAKLLSGGNYDIDFNGRGFLEIRELSDTLNAAAAELSKVENLRRELMANVSHDLRTPLALIYSYAEMMNDFPDEITPQQTQTIMDETKRLASLVNDVLDISQFERRSVELHKSRYCLTESIAGTIQRTAEFVKKDGYDIDFVFDEKIDVMADEVKITQALYNLLINAINYSGADKRITVRQGVFGDRVKIEVSDNGEGISPDDMPYVWDRYYKADKKHRRPIAGTGLGLSIVKKIIDMHGGNCGATSEPGKGSTFWFEIGWKT